MIREQGLRAIRFSAEAMSSLQAYAWPGNVRELKNFVERLFILYPGQEVTGAMLPPEYQAAKARPFRSSPCRPRSGS